MTTFFDKYDDTIQPKYTLQGKNAADKTLTRQFVANLAIKVGRVIKSHEPRTEGNPSPFWLYDVLVVTGSEYQVQNVTVLPQCRVMSLFGSPADFTRWTPRPTEISSMTEFLERPDDGSWVLVTLLNGAGRAGVIIGGIPHANSESDMPDLGHHFSEQFNGIRREIDKEGQLTISFKGATAPNGELAEGVDAEASGSTIKMDKTGSILLHTKDEAQRFKLAHDSGHVELVADELLDVQVNKDAQINIDGVATAHIGKTLDIYSEEEMTLSTDRRSYIKSMGLQIGDATDATMMGTTYRVAEAAYHAQLMSILGQLTTVAANLGAAAVSLAAAGAANVGSASAALPEFTAAAASLTAAATGLTAATTQHMAAVSTFEAQGPRYLSLKNNSD